MGDEQVKHREVADGELDRGRSKSNSGSSMPRQARMRAKQRAHALDIAILTAAPNSSTGDLVSELIFCLSFAQLSKP